MKLMLSSVPSRVERHRTAIKRRRFSKPTQLLLDDGILASDVTFFDYGCGYGEDVRFLKQLGFSARGWDPYYAARRKQSIASVVNLGFVLNVIEDEAERTATLRRAWELAEDLLVVSVVTRETFRTNNAVPCWDGYLTTWKTFQRPYTQSEFRAYLGTILPEPPVLASLGIAYVFKSDRFRPTFLQNRIKGRTADMLVALREAENQRVLSRWIDLYHELGRIPSRTEFAETGAIVRLFGSLEAAREAVRAEVDVDTVLASANRRKEQVLIAVCRQLVRGNGVAKFADLPENIRPDLRALYGSFEHCRDQALLRLKSLAELENISRHIAASAVGKIMPDDIYIHVDALGHAPEMLQVLVELALMAVPDNNPYNVVKIARNSWHVTFLYYPAFFDEEHPSLATSMKVFLHKNQLKYRDYSKSANPPILHRKEEFLYPEHPRYEEFAALTHAEEEAGLLGRSDIGTRKQWYAAYGGE